MVQRAPTSPVVPRSGLFAPEPIAAAALACWSLLLPGLAGADAVAEAEQFVERGGVAGLGMQGNHVQFSFNLRAAHAANLKISSDLLKLASAVIAGGRN